MDGGDDLLTVPEVSLYLRKSPSTIYRLTREGKLPGKKIGGTWRYSRRRIDELFHVAPDSPLIDPSAETAPISHNRLSAGDLTPQDNPSVP